jgi:predicted molibdopterin-dependent oxidoreductase YjgC
MFIRNQENGDASPPTLSFTWDGRPYACQEGDTVAAALLSCGIKTNRNHPVSEDPRAPFCMMGTCFECLVEIDGIANKQGCQVKLCEGMDIRRQVGARK